MAEDPRRRPEDGPHIPAEKARGGEIILRTPARRWIFVGGLVALIVIAVIGYWLG
jgi:hypothetical protein